MCCNALALVSLFYCLNCLNAIPHMTWSTILFAISLQVSIAYMHLLGAEKPWETMLMGCLWLAAKLEECRRGVPTASKAGALVGVDKHVIGGVELYLMQLVDWAPLADWKDRPLQLEDDSWY